MTQKPAVLVEACELEALPFPVIPAWNIAPTQIVAAVRLNTARKRELVPLRWGLIPAWAKEPAVGNKLFNARAETLLEKVTFRRALEKRRCLIPADGFYEWEKTARGSCPWRFGLRGGALFGMAGLWERWAGADGSEVESCTVITTAANRMVAPLNRRMPVMLRPPEFDAWLTPSLMGPGATTCLRPLDEDLMERLPLDPTTGAAWLPKAEGMDGDVQLSLF
jgi:putative SOS response-associated peptidase YedK